MPSSAVRTACVLLFATSGALPAQAASSNWFLPSARVGPGELSQSTNWVLAGALGSGASGAASASANHVLVGGFCGQLEAPVTGRPWITGVSPARAGLLGGTPLTVHGTELQLVGGASLTIGGVPAPISGATLASFQTLLPLQPQPGPRLVSLNSGFGTTALPAGMGVLPLIEWKSPPQANQPFEFVYHGRFGDVFVMVLGLGPFPFPIPFPPFHYGLALDPSWLMTTAGVGVGDPNGMAVLSLPRMPQVSGFHVQVVALTADPTYALGSFSNVISIQ